MRKLLTLLLLLSGLAVADQVLTGVIREVQVK